MEIKKIEEILVTISRNLSKIPKAMILSTLIDYQNNLQVDIERLVNTDILKAVWIECDGTLNITQIAKKLGKNKGTISNQVKPWIEAKIVFELSRDNSKFPMSIDSIIKSIIISCIE